jgi:flagellar biosynthetic protein FliQ
MTIDILIDMAQHSIFTMLLIVGPVMISSFVVGIIMSLLQAIFQIHEQTFSFVPKLLAILGTIVLFAPWMLRTLLTFAEGFFGGFNRYLQ